MADWPLIGASGEIIISPYSELALGTEYAAIATVAPASVALGTINLSKFYPFAVPEPMLIRKVWWYNGGTVNGNTDVGIFDDSGTRIISSGAVAQATINVLQEFDITDTYIGRGRFYMGISTSSATATYFSNVVPLQLAKAIGWAQMASAHPLPATVTFAALAAAVQPVFGCSARVLVV